MMGAVSVGAGTGKSVSTAALATVAACGLGLAAGWNISSITTIASSISRDYGIPLATVGFFTTALFVAHAAIQIPGGRLIDRVGAKRMGLIGLSIITVTSALALIAPTVWLGILCRAVMGLGTGISFVAGSDYIRRSGAGPLAQGVYGGIGLAGGGIAIAVVPLVENLVHWRSPFVTSVVVAVVAMALLAVGPHEGARRHASKPTGAPHERAPVQLYRLMVMHICSFGLSVLASNWIVELLKRHGESKSTAALVGSLTLVAGVISRPLGGWLAVKPWSRTAIGASIVMGALGCGLLLLAPPLAPAIIGSLLIGLAAGIPFASIFVGAARARPHAPARAVGMTNASGSLIILAGSPIVGATFSLPGAGRIGFAAIALIWASGLLYLPTRRELGLE